MRVHTERPLSEIVRLIIILILKDSFGFRVEKCTVTLGICINSIFILESRAYNKFSFSG